MIIFGGKLIASESDIENFKKNNVTHTLKQLSNREKELLAELDRTRKSITSELDALDYTNDYDSILYSKSTSKVETKKLTPSEIAAINRNKRLLHSGTISNASPIANSYPQSSNRAKTAVDMMPILASTGEYAFEVGLRKQGALKLPVITPPTTATIQQQQRNQHRNKVRAVNKTQSLNSGQSEKEKSADNFFTRSYTLDSSLNFEERAFIQTYLRINDEEYDSITTNPDKIFGKGIEEASNAFTVFQVAKFVISGKNISNGNIDQGDFKDFFTSTNTPFNRSLRGNNNHDQTLTTQKTLPKTQSMPKLKSTQTLLTQGSLHIGESRMESLHTASFAENTMITKNSKVKTKSKHSKKHGSQSHVVAWGDQEDPNSATSLKKELLQSLANMQKHTSEVKQSILNVQEIVAVANPKARNFVLSIAADQMAACLRKLVEREIKRGWLAWTIEVNNRKLAEKGKLFYRFQNLRKLVIKLNAVVAKALYKKFSKWVEYCVAVKHAQELKQQQAAVLLIQRVGRGYIGRKRARKVQETTQFTRMYDALIKLQAMFRCKIHRWRYLKYLRNKLEIKSTLLLQRVGRGFLARKRVRRMKMYNHKALAAIKIQAWVRGIAGRKKVAALRLLRLKNQMAVRIQALARGYISRKSVQKFLQDRIEYDAAIMIQKIIRGALVRMNMHRHRAALEEYRNAQYRAATQIQAAYRGYRGRLVFKYMMEDHRQWVELQKSSAIAIQKTIRRFLAKVLVAKMRQEQHDNWILVASKWKEMWAEDSATWFYYNEETREAHWEPLACGYVKSDGMIVLPNGKIVEPPDPHAKKNDGVCIECAERTAIRKCHECDDCFCVPCYKQTHATGGRKKHNWEALGPLECSDCETNLAERWCVSCDEAFCDDCWRKVHSKGKRRFHPFSEVFSDGNIDSRIFTIDGEQVYNYDASYAQHRQDDSVAREYEQPIDSYLKVDQQAGYEEYDEDAQQQAVKEEWTVYQDDNGYDYYYNNYTGLSQYENPYQ